MESGSKKSINGNGMDNYNNDKSISIYPPPLLKRKRKFENEVLMIPNKIKKKISLNLINDGLNNDIVLYKSKPSKGADNSTNSGNSPHSNPSKDKPDLKDPKLKNTKDEEIKDLLNEISEITATLDLFEMQKRKKKMIKMLEVMADNIDENTIDLEQLTNEFFFGKKDIKEKSIKNKPPDI